ncbi:MAG: NAD(P)H-dependent oxidoreductase subunit E [Negativicutes bacterium]|jgi:NADP-reducing hydrogenase subunit HndA
MSCCCNSGVDERKEQLAKIARKYKTTKGALIKVLHEAQELYGYLPVEAQEIISKNLGVPMTEIYGVITFYGQFSLKEKGKYQISVCMGTACYVKGSSLLLEKLKERLSIEVGNCTEDKKFSLEACRCIGACGLAPVLTVNKDVHGRLLPEDVDRILALYE